LDTDILDRLNEAQREAVTHGDGPLLVLAGPGSGKTRVITTRVAHLLGQGVPPWQILAITFTNKAAGEMRERTEAMVGRAGVWISTFHSMCVRLLRRYAEPAGIQSNFSIYDTDDRVKLIRNVMKELSLDSTHWRPPVIEAAISRAKNDMVDAAGYGKDAHDFFRQTVARVFKLYETRLREANALDFDDLLLVMAELLKRDAAVRSELDKRFRYVLIDEYQDTNLAQYAIARALSVDYPNICATGDPDQSIYGWRGANIQNILKFEDDYPDTVVVRLEENYRSTRSILHAADTLIRNNRQRKHKDLRTGNARGQAVAGLELDDEQAEADEVADRIARHVADGGRYADVAIFFRMNALTRVFEQSLSRKPIPYQIIAGVAFFQRKEIKDVLAYLRLIVNPADSVSFARVVNVPTRGIGATTVNRLAEWANARNVPLHEAAARVEEIGTIGPRPKKLLTDFVRMVEAWRTDRQETAEAEVLRVIEKSGLEKALAKSGDPEDDERLANVQELVTAASQFDVDNGDTDGLEGFLEQVSLVSDIDSYEGEKDVVTLMTLHAAKGLEFPVVFMPAVELNILPHARSQESPAEMEEERRLCFVGMTRAMQVLTLSHVQYRRFRGQVERTVPSPFIEELPSDGVVAECLAEGAFFQPTGRPGQGESQSDDSNFWDDAVADVDPFARLKVGLLVRHPSFGLGRIVSIDGYGKAKKATVKFNIAGQKRLVLEHANLEPAD